MPAEYYNPQKTAPHLVSVQHEIFHCSLLQLQPAGHQSQHVLVPGAHPGTLLLSESFRAGLQGESPLRADIAFASRIEGQASFGLL